MIRYGEIDKVPAADRGGGVEAREGAGEAFSGGFDEGFLAGPAGEKDVGVGVGGTKVGELIGVELLGEGKGVGHGSEGFEVDADVAGGGDGEEGQAARVGEIEVEVVAF